MPSVSADPTIVPRPLVMFILLQYEVVQFDYVCVLIVERVEILDRYACEADTYPVFKLVRRPIDTDDEFSTVWIMGAG